MKQVKAIIRPFKFDDARQALEKIGITNLTVADAQGCGKQKGHTGIFLGKEHPVEFIPKLEIVVVVEDAQVDKAVNAIREAAMTGRVGDGKILVTPVEEAIRISTGERGPAALRSSSLAPAP